MFNNLSKREKIIMIIGIIILLTALYYFNLYLPLQNKIKNIKTEIHQKENNIEILKEIEQKLPETRSKYEKLKKREKSNKLSVLSSADMLEIFGENIEKYDVSLISFKPKNGNAKTQIDLTYQSEFYNLIKLFQYFDEFNNQIQFRNLNIYNEKGNLKTKIKVVLRGGKQNEN